MSFILPASQSALIPIGFMALMIAFIAFQKYFSKVKINSFDLHHVHFLFGLGLSLFGCLITINMSFPNTEKDNYYTEPIESEGPDIPITKWVEKKVEKIVIKPPKVEAKKELFVRKIITTEEPLPTEIPLVHNIKDVVQPLGDTVAQSEALPLPVIPEPVEDEIEIVADKMARFPGCEDLDLDLKEKETCAQKALMSYIYANLSYPPLAREAGIEGMVVIQFVVWKDGKIKRAKIVRDIGGGCGHAALKVVESMNDMSEHWIPAKKYGHPVNIQFTLPVKFTLK